MSKKLKCQELFDVTEQEKQYICAALGLTLDGYWDLRRQFMEHIDRSEHLPKDYDAVLLAGCIFNNKASIERGKRFFDNYFRCKNDYAEEMFDHCLPGSEKFKESIQYSYSVCTRKLLPAPSCSRVQVFKLNDPEGKASDPFVYMIMLAMMAELRGSYDFWLSSIAILDMEHLTMRNILKYSAHFLMATKDLFESINLRITGLHFVNGPAVLDKMIGLVKAVMPAKLRDRIYIHQDYESLQKVIPKECLPKDYGGYDDSIEDLHKQWIEAMEELKPFYERCRAAKSTKKHEFDDNERDSMGIGVEGTFKQLVID